MELAARMREKREATLRVATVSFCLAAVCVLGGASAVRIYDWLTRHPTLTISVPLTGIHTTITSLWISSTVGITFFIAFAKDVIGIFRNFGSHAAQIDTHQLLRDCVETWFVVCSACLVLFTYKPPTSTDPPPVVFASPFLPAYPIRDDTVLAVLPLFFKTNASRDEKGMWSAGVRLDGTSNPDAAALMHTLVSLLQAFCTPGSSDDWFRVTVRGFASSAEFRGATSSRSDELNQEVANLRARLAAEELKNTIGDQPRFVVEAQTFQTPSQMTAARWYLDRLNTGSDGSQPRQVDAEELDRRVELVINEAGSCKTREELLQKLRRATYRPHVGAQAVTQGR